ncbi:hypothetical protein GGX14DRAFT_581024 [Mycena pura]|uniref:Uncharacterized protein n=1 Tax=Mycena pura TaxID=153505 RepID=A0AAD6UP82_9AGAR|nr:hypothetical protein GGX14DRAFT_581024 [Mycena pura]
MHPAAGAEQVSTLGLSISALALRALGRVLRSGKELQKRLSAPVCARCIHGHARHECRGGAYGRGHVHGGPGACAEGGCARDGGMGRVGCFYSACTEAVVVPAPAPFAVPPRPMFAPCPPPSPRVRAVPAHTLSRSRFASAPPLRVRVRPQFSRTRTRRTHCARVRARAGPCAPLRLACTRQSCPHVRARTRVRAVPAHWRPARLHALSVHALPAPAYVYPGAGGGSARARRGSGGFGHGAGVCARAYAGKALQGGRGRACAVCRRMQALPRRVPHVHVRSRPTFAPAAMRPLRPRTRTRHTRRARAHDTYVHVPYTPCKRPRTPTHWYALYAPCQRRNYVYLLCHAPHARARTAPAPACATPTPVRVPCA